MMQREPWLGTCCVSVTTLVTYRFSKTSRSKEQPKPQCGHVVRVRSTCQNRDLTGLRFSVREPTGQTLRHSPHDVQSSGWVTVIFASMPLSARSSTPLPETSLQACTQRRQSTHLS